MKFKPPINKIVLPLKRRWYQKEFEEGMKNKKRALLCYHRRGGKDIACWNYLIKQALKEKAVYYYIFPEYSQARKAFWDSITEDGQSYLDFIPRKCIRKKWNHEMKLLLISGSIIQILGSDNYDAIRGTNPKGVVLSEYAYQNPLIWNMILDPILTKNKGWAVFNSTPQGKNHFYEMYNYALKNPNDWYVSKLTIENTKLIEIEELEKKKEQGISEELIEQEYYCSFEIGIQGSFYGRSMNQMEEEGRICSAPYDKNFLVYTAWDLGFSDAMSIIFFQKRGNEILIIDHYENHGFALNHYLEVLKSKNYSYGTHYIPHDGKAHSAAGTTFLQIARESGYRFEVLENKLSVMEGIEKVRGIFPRIFIDKEKCGYLIKCLLQYHSEWDDRAKIFRNRPKHDWSSHSCDAFRYMCLALDVMRTPANTMTKEKLKELRQEVGIY